MLVAPSKRRSVATDGPGGFVISIPVTRSIFVLLFLPVWLVMWFTGETSALQRVTRAGHLDVFLAAWLVAWTAGGVAVVMGWLWTALGVEVVTLGTGMLAIRRQILGVGYSREYELSQVANLRVAPRVAAASVPSGRRREFLPMGVIAFDYGAKTYRFGSVEEAEVAQIVAELKARYAFPGESGITTARS